MRKSKKPVGKNLHFHFGKNRHFHVDIYTIKLIYKIKTANNNWIEKDKVFSSGKEYEEAVQIIHTNPTKYQVVKVEHIDSEQIDS